MSPKTKENQVILPSLVIMLYYLFLHVTIIIVYHTKTNNMYKASFNFEIIITYIIYYKKTSMIICEMSQFKRIWHLHGY